GPSWPTYCGVGYTDTSSLRTCPPASAVRHSRPTGGALMVRLIILGAFVVSVASGLLGATRAVEAAPLSPGDILVADQGGFVYQYSVTGADLGAFASGLRSPSWITVDPDGNVYVTEYGLNEPGTIIKFGPDGARLLAISTPFTAAGVAIAPDGTIFVAHYGRE